MHPKRVEIITKGRSHARRVRRARLRRRAWVGDFIGTDNCSSAALAVTMARDAAESKCELGDKPEEVPMSRHRSLTFSKCGSLIVSLLTLLLPACASPRREDVAGQAPLASAALEEGAITTTSGLIYKEIVPGGGSQPVTTDKVKVHYEGRFVDGTIFDSSIQRGEPATFPLDGVIKCWAEGVQRMRVGGKSRLICPPNLAFGDRGSSKVKPGATLIFEVQLLGIVSSDKAPVGIVSSDKAPDAGTPPRTTAAAKMAPGAKIRNCTDSDFENIIRNEKGDIKGLIPKGIDVGCEMPMDLHSGRPESIECKGVVKCVFPVLPSPSK